jgi:hypothetical protein
MAKASRPVKTITINKSRDIIVDRLLKQCEQDNHSKCTGWAVLKKEISPIDANYFLKCTCACHHHKKAQPQASRKKKPKKSIATSRMAKRKAKKKAKRQQKKRSVKRSKKKSRKTRKR